MQVLKCFSPVTASDYITKPLLFTICDPCNNIIGRSLWIANTLSADRQEPSLQLWNLQISLYSEGKATETRSN
jgi:hypothetical protein